MTAATETIAKLRVIAHRDFTIMTSYRLQFVMRSGSGLLAVAALFFLGRVVGDSPGLGAYRAQYFEFALLGTIVLAFASVALQSFSQTITEEQRAGTLEVLISGPTGIPTLLAGMFVVPLANTLFTVAIYLIIAVGLFGASFALGGVLPGLVLLVLTLTTFCAFGILSAALIVVSKRGDPLSLGIAHLTTFLGGAMFPVTVLPEWLQAAARFFPPYYGLEGLRQALLLDAGFAGVRDELVVVGAFAAVLLPLSLAAFRLALRSARVLGTLGDF